MLIAGLNIPAQPGASAALKNKKKKKQQKKNKHLCQTASCEKITATFSSLNKDFGPGAKDLDLTAGSPRSASEDQSGLSGNPEHFRTLGFHQGPSGIRFLFT